MTSPNTPEISPAPSNPEDAESLKRKLLEVQAQMAALKAEVGQLREKKNPFSSQHLKTWVIVLGVVLLGVIPPALVMASQWFYVLPGNWRRDLWCKVDFLCTTRFPSYFSVIIGCILVLAVVLLFFGRKPAVVIENALVPQSDWEVPDRQMRIGFYLLVASAVGMAGVILLSLISRHWPGWDLVLVWLLCLAGWAVRAVPVSAVADFWRKNGEFLISLLLMHIATITTLAAYYDVPQIFFLSLLFLVLAFGNLWRFRQRVPVIFWIISVTLAFYCININAWWTSVVGDDYDFHDMAWQFAEKWGFFQIGNVLFKANGVFGAHPYFSSFVQAISIKLLGHDSFGWRFSSLYLSAIGVGLFYLFCKSFLSRRAALVATCLLAFSHYVMSFGKIGYNNLQALFALSLALAAAAWALRWKNPLVFALLGSSLALCFYLYPAALYVIPLPLFLLLLYYQPVSRQAAKHWLIMFVTWVALIYPLMMQPAYWTTKVDGTIFNRSELLQSSAVIGQHFTQNIFYSIFSYLYIDESHFIAVSYVDPLTAIFISIGFFVLLYQIRRQRFAIFTLLAYVGYLFLVGASHDRETPSNTRMFLMLPLFALFGTWGILWVEEKIKKIFDSQANSQTILIPFLVVAIAAMNLYQAYQVSYVRYSSVQSAETLFMKITQDIHQAQPNVPKNIVVITGDGWGIAGLVEFQNVYPYLAWFHVYQIQITEPVVSEAEKVLLADKDTVILISPYLSPEWQAALDAPLIGLGKNHCDVLSPDKQKRFVLYYPPDLPQACPQY